MKYCSLMSGSWGNCHYIETAQTKIMVDVGQSGRNILQNMQMAGCGDGKDLDAILVTHAHRDHVIGVGILARKLKVPVYATEGTWHQMKGLVGDIPAAQTRVIGTESSLQIGDLQVESFPTSHDALESVGYVIRNGQTGLGIATDCGIFSSCMERCLKDLQALVLEANHDLTMLRQGRYPEYLKRRIAGVEGHLSNEDAAKGLLKVLGSQTKQVILAHLSEENNHPELALESVRRMIDKPEVKISVSPRCTPGEWMEI
jgi:phosphoribosyl 1,2-cyclic phosphodiesterase